MISKILYPRHEGGGGEGVYVRHNVKAREILNCITPLKGQQEVHTGPRPGQMVLCDGV